jgi:predicted dehydrogenase
MKLNHAIIGCGRVARNHLFACNQLKFVDVNHFCDCNINKAIELSSNVASAYCCTDYEEIITNPKIDSVSVCTDHGSHYEISLKCIQNGKHVIIEKPVCIKDEHAQVLINTSIFHPNSIVSVISQHRYDPLITEIHNIIKEGILGKITAILGMVQCSKKENYYSDWHGKILTEGGSALINQGIHTLDLMIWMAGTIIKTFAIRNRMKFNIETEDNICAALYFDSQALGTLICTTTSSIEWDSYIDIVGTEGSIRFTTDFPNRLISVNINKYPQVISQLKNIEAQKPKNPVGQHYYGISHNSQISNYFNAILGHEKLKVSLIDGVETLRTVNMIYKSAGNM